MLFPFATVLAAVTQTPWEYALAVFKIVWIDIVLAGDNAVVIALAVRTLEPRQRLWGIILGAGAAVLLRASLTLVATHLLTVHYVQLVGGLLILWIAFKLLRQNEGDENEEKQGASGLWQAVWMILVADITMSLDNVLAVAGAAHGDNGLIYFGLVLSIPLVVFASNLISKLMARYQIVVFLGAAILGKVGGEMIMMDRFTSGLLQPLLGRGTADPATAYTWLRYAVEAVLVAVVFAYGWSRRRKPAPEAAS